MLTTTPIQLNGPIFTRDVNQSVSTEFGFMLQLVCESQTFLLVGEAFLLPALSVGVDVLDRPECILLPGIIFSLENTSHCDAFLRTAATLCRTAVANPELDVFE